ncbi:leucine-rich repeat domain-containing protein [Sporofaciens sp. SGI.106]|uniref:leucine-rich repeat domain-containing protein n=1 Tax=Sporofaciens sp. SGI.106 TaxID=3420568 RepID=UPI003CFBF834
MNKKIVFLPYDMDTAIGINNEGSLVFSYNLEDIDQTEGGADIYNGQQSVLWKNLREMFPEELRAMYQTLRSTGVISYDKIEKAFEEHQAKWPEAIFNEDAWFKYLAPLEEKGSAAYLAMLLGSKAEQRKWWLYNRFRYIDSKYNAGDSLTDVITLRGYAKSDITITPYADVYATVKYGSYLVQTRAERNKSYVMECPLDNVNDTEIYIYSASQLADVGDLSALRVGYAEFVYATKLQQLILGNPSQYYTNGNLQTLYLGKNKLLKKLDVRNCTGLGTGDQKTVDLSGCTGIEEVYFDGTKITGVTLPNGGVLRVLHLPSTITSLIIRNQNALTDFTCPSLSSISTLWLENVGSTVDTKAILESLGTGARVRLFGFRWELEQASEISDMFDILDDMRGIDQNGDNMPTAQVYGTIYVPNITGDILAHAKDRYPDIAITYDHVSAVLTFKDNDGSVLATETILDGADPTMTPAMGDKEDGRYYYTFLGWGKVQDGEVDDNALKNIQADTVVYAIYALEEKVFTVRFFNGTELLATYSNVAYGSTIEYDEIPVYNGVGNPGDYVFTGWSVLPENITSNMDCYAEYQFVGLYFRQLMNGTLLAYDDTDNLETIADYAFAGNRSLVSVNMPMLTAIPENCFRGCSALSEINLPKVLATNEYSFYYCESIERIKLPELTIMNEGTCFQNLTALKVLRLPKNTSSLAGNKIFACNALELLDLGLVTEIGANINSSSSWAKLTTLILRNETTVVTPYSTTVFSASSPLGKGEGKILVPRSMVASYKADSTWGAYTAEIYAIEDYPELAE